MAKTYGEWVIFSTPDGDKVTVPLDDIVCLWSGKKKGEMVVETNSLLDPIVVLGDMELFMKQFFGHYDLSKRLSDLT